ncbi:MAG: beta-ketoacyl synthase N-terminal-like domain-containing protein, partial [Chthoniobacterales bacterium]
MEKATEIGKESVTSSPAKSNAINGKNARVAVVATGVVSPLGLGLDETLDALRTARDRITPVKRFSVDQCRCKTAGQIPDERLLDEQTNGHRARRLHRAAHMMAHALGGLLDQVPEFKPELAVIGTTSGGMSFGEDYYRSLHRQRPSCRVPGWIANYPAQKPVVDALD